MNVKLNSPKVWGVDRSRSASLALLPTEVGASAVLHVTFPEPSQNFEVEFSQGSQNQFCIRNGTRIFSFNGNDYGIKFDDNSAISDFVKFGRLIRIFAESGLMDHEEETKRLTLTALD